MKEEERKEKQVAIEKADFHTGIVLNFDHLSDFEQQEILGALSFYTVL